MCVCVSYPNHCCQGMMIFFSVIQKNKKDHHSQATTAWNIWDGRSKHQKSNQRKVCILYQCGNNKGYKSCERQAWIASTNCLNSQQLYISYWSKRTNQHQLLNCCNPRSISDYNMQYKFISQLDLPIIFLFILCIFSE